MSADLATALATAGGATILAVITYALTKKREMDAELRRERLEHYKDFMASLGPIIANEITDDIRRAIGRSCNNLNLVAPQSVIEALQAFQDEVGASNANPSRQRHDQLLSRILYEMRKDLGVWPKDNQGFKASLWGSGIGKQKNGP
jgi:hypothetical protein